MQICLMDKDDGVYVLFSISQSPTIVSPKKGFVTEALELSKICKGGGKSLRKVMIFSEFLISISTDDNGLTVLQILYP